MKTNQTDVLGTSLHATFAEFVNCLADHVVSTYGELYPELDSKGSNWRKIVEYSIDRENHILTLSEFYIKGIKNFKNVRFVCDLTKKICGYLGYYSMRTEKQTTKKIAEERLYEILKNNIPVLTAQKTPVATKQIATRPAKTQKPRNIRIHNEIKGMFSVCNRHRWFGNQGR